MAFGGCVRKMCWPDAYGERPLLAVFLPVTTTKSDGQIQCKWRFKAAENAEGKNFRYGYTR
ncbi:hypothetical protein D3C76_1755000 [compost metagenome]